jgi:dTMP kinase
MSGCQDLMSLCFWIWSLRRRELFLGLLKSPGSESDMQVVDAGESVEVVGDRILEKIEAKLKKLAVESSGVGTVEAWPAST